VHQFFLSCIVHDAAASLRGLGDMSTDHSVPVFDMGNRQSAELAVL
jgi:hypothetical protein